MIQCFAGLPGDYVQPRKKTITIHSISSPPRPSSENFLDLSSRQTTPVPLNAPFQPRDVPRTGNEAHAEAMRILELHGGTLAAAVKSTRNEFSSQPSSVQPGLIPPAKQLAAAGGWEKNSSSSSPVARRSYSRDIVPSMVKPTQLTE